MGGERARLRNGYSLAEVAVVLAILAVVGSAAVGVYGRLADGRNLRAGVRSVRGELQYARMTAVARREVVRLRTRDGTLVLFDSRDRELRRSPLTGGAGWGWTVDSARLRPRTLRFNSRGQAGPGSVYLYRGRRSVRIVINFVGRMREERSGH